MKEAGKEMENTLTKGNTRGGVYYHICTEFPIPWFVRFHHVLYWEFPCPAWAVAAVAAHKPGELPKT